VGTVCLLLGRHRDEKSSGALNDSDFPDHQTVVEDNVDVGSDQAIVGLMDCNFRNLHVHSNPNVSRFHAVGDFLQRSSFLNISGEESYDSTGAYDGYGEPGAPKWPAKAILFPH
jgi:hypothetical protein